MGKPGQIGEIQVISGMVILFWHYVLAQAGRSSRLDQIQIKLVTLLRIF